MKGTKVVITDVNEYDTGCSCLELIDVTNGGTENEVDTDIILCPLIPLVKYRGEK